MQKFCTVLNNNLLGIQKQVDEIFDGKAVIVNNFDWFKDYNYLDFLRDVGKYINVNYMLNKDIIKRRLDTGITYAEFSYTLIQGYDFLRLFLDKNCILQNEDLYTNQVFESYHNLQYSNNL